MDTTIIYYTDNTLAEPIAARCRELLLESAEGLPIVSVSQEPIDLGENICVGKIGRSWLSLYKQLFAGLTAAKTRYVATAEHDCVYAPEHFRWTPPRDDTFYYNDNMWLGQWQSTKPELDGMFSYWPRRLALSQLICSREMLLNSTSHRLDFLDAGRGMAKRVKHIAEPGFTEIPAVGKDLKVRKGGTGTVVRDSPKWHKRLLRVQKYASNGSHAYLQPMLDSLQACLNNEKTEFFKTVVPNIDIRHKGNFTGPKRGRNRRWELEPWGKLEELML